MDYRRDTNGRDETKIARRAGGPRNYVSRRNEDKDNKEIESEGRMFDRNQQEEPRTHRKRPLSESGQGRMEGWREEDSRARRRDGWSKGERGDGHRGEQKRGEGENILYLHPCYKSTF